MDLYSPLKRHAVIADRSFFGKPQLIFQKQNENIRRVKDQFSSDRGFPFPFGATKFQKGINFSVFSRHATALSLCLFKEGEKKPFFELPLDPKKNKTGNVWHVFLSEVNQSFCYGFRAEGPYEPFKGVVYDNRFVVLDPYAKLLCSAKEWGTKDDTHITTGKICPHDPFDWGEDKPPNIPLKDLIIYEMHVRGFTRDKSSGVQQPGTFLGMIEKIPYLKSLGVNAVELMPIHEFRETENIHKNPKTGEQLYNYWGYSTVNFFSPMNRYGTLNGDTINEFKTLVKELHANGIEVILDVVYNHTAEGNKQGPTLSFRGFENSVYYMLAPNGEYYNFSGCGNTMNCNNPVVREFIRDSLRYWVMEMHVDGFRFDLASILVRGHDGVPLANPPLIEAITLDPILANVKLIAEAWDAGGLYQVGSFPGLGVWAEWNGQYRDSVRRFIKGTDGEIGNFATRLAGSEDLYWKGNRPAHSINFVCAHDGFTLSDLVSYNEKHNEENGEGNRDGTNDNESWNCGAEGPSTDPKIIALRQRQRKNFHLALMVSQGVPMILMGDEYGHTKNGNNNSWGHDSRLNWFQWDQLNDAEPFFRFYTMMIDFRKKHPVLSHTRFLRQGDIFWHGVKPNEPDWSSKSRFLAFTLIDKNNGYKLYISFNAFYQELTAQLPKVAKPWIQLVNTSLPSPQDIVEEKDGTEIKEENYTFPSYSSLILKSLL